MMIRALNTIALVVAVVLAFALYRAKTEAHAARERLDALTVMVEEERRAAAVLRAEIAFLERPERLRALAARHLGLEPTAPEQETTLEGALLALGEPAAQARFAAAQQAAPAPEAEPAPETRVAETAPETDTEPSLIEQLQQPERRIAQAEPPVSSPPLRNADDPIASLIVAAGGVR